jgi:MarR family transcriptional regulator, organic hydroperoxide resistance regulator
MEATGNQTTGHAEEEDLALVPVGLAFRSMLRAFERDTGVGAPRWFLLSMVAEKDGLSQGEVCRRFEQDPSRVTRLAQGLENDGLIRRERGPGDNRVVRMYLTEAGRELVREFPKRLVRFERRVSRAISGEELGELRRLLGVLTEAMKD